LQWTLALVGHDPRSRPIFRQRRQVRRSSFLIDPIRFVNSRRAETHGTAAGVLVTTPTTGSRRVRWQSDAAILSWNRSSVNSETRKFNDSQGEIMRGNCYPH
jgi:hypothetical protein